ncbi:zinc finger CCCH domain-containing protein 34-like [Lolium rigidum]|uniref:zinc finger CCCH domain-containing protein 34-like n=1 Tax=Lolium rigidum TaxID=89674 RepID=UPI001F5CD940|nr:zinc finger CCCH domain-containing protein 34-like [Lolium rigidum]
MASAAAAEGGEDPRRRRSDTDCVFFLVSRVSCTKGSKCEYRHCEAARFNPRNCWYWFHGNCVNPSCTFRHPPMENFNRTKSLSVPPSSYGSVPSKETKPCYFYYSSSCIKADNCPFLHEPRTPNNDVGITSQATAFNPDVNEKSAGDEMAVVSKDAHANPCQDTPCYIKKCHSEEVHESRYPEVDGAISIAAKTSIDTGEHMKCFTHSDQRSGDSTLEDTEQDESRDSSPGFDVLVDDGLSNKNDLEQQLTQKRDAQVLHVKYDFGDPACYDQDYYDSQCYGQAFCGFDNQHSYLYFSHLEGVQDHDTETTSGHVPHNGRNLVRSSSDEYGKRFFNSRNFISSAADVAFSHQHIETRHSSKRRLEKRNGAKGRKRRTKRQRGLQPVNDSQETESRFTQRRQDFLMEECPQSVVCATFRGQKKKLRGKQHNIISARSSEHPTADFTGPKTLAQIKEENSVSKSSFSHCVARMPHGRSFSNDFEGPKSLAELLKTKGGISIG